MKIKLRNEVEKSMLQKGVEYIVYALYMGQRIELMVLTEIFSSAPIAVSLDEVEVVDGRASKYWTLGAPLNNSQHGDGRTIISFPEWANDEYFYQKLVEGSGDAGVKWRLYRDWMSVEFEDFNILLKAIDIGAGWIQCGNCSNAWLPHTEDAILECPSCNSKQNRPPNGLKSTGQIS